MGVNLDFMNSDKGQERKSKEEIENVENDQKPEVLPDEKIEDQKILPDPSVELNPETQSVTDYTEQLMMKVLNIENSIEELRRLSNQINQSLQELSEKVNKIDVDVNKANDNISSESEKRSDRLSKTLEDVVQKQTSNDRMLAQALKENASFQSQVRMGMKKELDQFKEQESGKQYDPILGQIASIYVEYGKLLLPDEAGTEKSNSNIESLFESLEEILDDYNAEIIRTSSGSPCPSRHVKIVEKIPTADESMHRIVVASRNPGVVREKSTLYPERVDVYVYDPNYVPEEKPYAETELKTEKIADNKVEPEEAGTEIGQAEDSETCHEAGTDSLTEEE